MLKKYIILFLVAWLVLIGVYVAVKDQLTPSGTVIRTSPTTVIKQMKALNRLETASFTIEKVIDAGTDGNRFQEVLFGDHILLIAHGEVIAGFDLSELKEDDARIEGSTITLQLPPPKVLVAKLDNEQTRVFDRQQGLLTKGDKDLESEARKAAEQTIQQAACQGGILNEASTNARKQLTTLLKALSFTDVIIQIPEGSC